MIINVVGINNAHPIFKVKFINVRQNFVTRVEECIVKLATNYAPQFADYKTTILCSLKYVIHVQWFKTIHL